MLNWLREYIRSHPIEEINKEWAEIEKLDFSGPLACDYLGYIKRVYLPKDNDLIVSKINLPENLTPNFAGSFFLCNIGV